MTDELPRKVGDEIYDDHGNMICRVAVIPEPGTPIMIEHFTDWRIPIPEVGDEFHPAIAAYCRDDPEIAHYAGIGPKITEREWTEKRLDEITPITPASTPLWERLTRK